MSRLRICIVAVGMLILFPGRILLAQQATPLKENERTLLAETFRLANEIQDSVWTNWSEAPFALLLVTPEREVLAHHPRPSSDFTAAGYDDRLGDTLYARPRQFPTNLRATFPAVSGVPTIVTGLPDSTDSPTGWVLTALHEHFHQWQMSRPGYYAAVDSLGLARGDDTGQWMLNYPFPYDSSAVQRRFASLRRRLKKALQATGQSGFSEKVNAYLKARRRFREVLAPDDYRYFSFQVWQEGVARYIEYKVAKRASQEYTPTEAFTSLDGYIPFVEAARGFRSQITERLATVSLAEDKRVAFYPVGAGEALLLDHVNPDWPRRYWDEKFYLERHFEGGSEP